MRENRNADSSISELPWRIQILAWIGSLVGKPRGWERVVRVFTSPERSRGLPDILVLREDMRFRAQVSVPLGWNILMFHEYEADLRKIIRSRLVKGAVAIDVGANAGWHTLLMAKLVGREGKVIAFEPNPSIFSQLEENVHTLNGLDQVTLLPVGLSDTTGTVSFFGPSSDDLWCGDGHILSPFDTVTENVIQIETCRLDDWFEESGLDRLDMIKVDIEGYEWPFFEGARKAIERYRPDIFFEYDRSYMVRGGGTAALFVEYFNAIEYTLFRVSRSGFVRLDLARESSEFLEILACPNQGRNS
jgi:FkbM family methyltransferase